MSQITSITPQKKDTTRCNIEVDGRFFCGMKLETVMQNRLKVGMSVDEEALAALQFEGERADALDKALSHISAAMKTEREIRDFLKKKGYLDAVIDDAVERMRGYGYVDDEAYARAYASSMGKKKGRRLIEAELRRKGVSDEAISSALSDLSGEDESASRQLEKYLRGKTIDKATLRKAYSFLLGKGYDGDTARAALQHLADIDED